MSEPDNVEPRDRDPWDDVVGHPELVERLRRAAADRTHAYLFVGPQGVGTRAAARAFAGEILAAEDPEHAERHRRLAHREQHPAMIVTERVGASISADQAREIVRRASLSPPEGTLQVLVLMDFHLVTQAAPIILKTLEEPPPSTVFIVVADDVPPDLVTIASRCVRFDFPPISQRVLHDTLMIEGASEETATAAAASAGGDLDRARLLVSDPEVIDRRRFWMEAPTRLDGTGARAAALVSEAMTRLDEVLGPLEEAQRRESLALVEQLDRIGAKKTATKELEARHNRERRRIRVDELHAGLAALVDGYRGEPFDAARFLTASSLVGKFVENLVFNPNEELALQGLFVALPRR